jgi:hypothetical protein
MAQTGEALMAGNTPRGIRKRVNGAGQPRYQAHYLVRDPASASGWIETSAIFPTLREAKAFKAERDNEAALGARRFDPRLGRIPLSRIWDRYSAPRKSRRSQRRHGVATRNTCSFASHRSSATSPSMRSGVPMCSSSSTRSLSVHGRKSPHSAFFAQFSK